MNYDIYYIFLLLIIVHVMNGCILNFHHLHQVVSVFSNKTIINNNRLQRCTRSRIAVKTLRTEFQHSGRLSDNEFRNCKPEKKKGLGIRGWDLLIFPTYRVTGYLRRCLFELGQLMK